MTFSTEFGTPSLSPRSTPRCGLMRSPFRSAPGWRRLCLPRWRGDQFAGALGDCLTETVPTANPRIATPFVIRPATNSFSQSSTSIVEPQPKRVTPAVHLSVGLDGISLYSLPELHRQRVAMSCSMERSSTLCARPKSSSKAGDATTTRSGLTRRSDTSRRLQKCSCLPSQRGRLRSTDRLRQPRWRNRRP